MDVNTQEIWVQGTPMALGKFVELLNEVDRRENAAFNTGGERIIRMPVSFAQGSVEELDALAELLDHLLEKGKTAHGHVDWVKTFCSNDPPYDVEIEPGQLKLEVKEIGPNTWFLIAEGTPDDIDIVRKMIEKFVALWGRCHCVYIWLFVAIFALLVKQVTKMVMAATEMEMATETKM